MKIEEIIAKKEKIEHDINSICRDFTNATGLIVDGVDLGKTEVTEMGSKYKEFLYVAKLEVKLP